MSEPPMRRSLIPLWLWAVAAAAVIGGVVFLVSTSQPSEPPQSFRYDVSGHEQVDSGHVLFEETGAIGLNIEEPRALAIGPDGAVFVGGKGLIAAYAGEGTERARFQVDGIVECLAVAPDGGIFFGSHDHVGVLTADGSPEALWDTFGPRARITSIAASSEDVYIADAGNRVVWRMDRNGAVQRRIGEKDDASDIPGLVVPSPYLDVTMDSAGALWVVNPGKHGIEQYRSNGDLVTSWYRPGMDVEGFCGCCNPAHIAFRSDGSLVTAEKGLVRVKLYAPDWTFTGVVAPPETFQERPTGAFDDDLENPIKDIAVDSQDRIMVLDGKAKAVRIFQERRTRGQ